MKKNSIRFLVAIAAVFVAFSVISFAVPWPKNGTFWLSYLFALIAIGAQVYAQKTAFPEGAGQIARSRFYGFPIARVGVIYGVIQLALSLIFMIANGIAANFDKTIPSWIPVILYIVLLAAAVIGFVGVDSMRDEIVRQDETHAEATDRMDELKSIVIPLASQVQEGDLKKSLSDLAEEFRFSDPVSGAGTEEIENELASLVSELQKAVVEEDLDGAATLVKKTGGALRERNRICKLKK